MGRTANPFKLFYMAVWRNFLILTRYKANFFFEILESLLVGGCMLLLSFAFDTTMLGQTVGSTNYVAFMIFGISFQSWQGIALWSASNIFQGELSTGQIDYTFSSSVSRYWYIVSNIAAQAVQSTIFFIPMFLIGLWLIGDTLTISGIFLGLAATLLSVAALAQLGTIFASLVLKFRQVTAIFGFFNIAFQFLTGMFIPFQLLPMPLKIVGQALPMTFGMDLLRHYVMKTNPIMVIENEWVLLLIQLIALSLIAKLTTIYLERSAKEQGLHYI
ncbi:MAG: ABC transporter permease [Thermoproteota archaeon]